jgi:hypothetical protein
MWTNLNEEDKSKITNLIKMLYNTINSIDNDIIKTQFKTILTLIEEKLLVNLEKNNSVINFKKINNIVNNNNIDSIFSENQINNIIQKINTLNTIIKNYFIKSINIENKNTDENIIVLLQNIINDIIKLLTK